MSKFRKFVLPALLVAASTLAAACGTKTASTPGGALSSLAAVTAVRLSYRYEADVPAPENAADAAVEERNAAVQNDFDQNRAHEALDKTIVSPDKKRVLAVYHRLGDQSSEFRLDMYTADGRLLRKVTADSMAVHFPDTIRWAPDSSSVAFVAMLRAVAYDPTATVQLPDANTAIQRDSNLEDPVSEPSIEQPAGSSTPLPPSAILTFRTEQIYLCAAEGSGVKPITQTEGLIYFYYTWAPDSSALAALAATSRDWAFLEQQAELKGEIFQPSGRPRIVERTGRERRLDDALMIVQPVWSPDSSKVAVAFDKQIRIYDATGNNPTQAAIPLRNPLLISSQAYDREQQTKLDEAAQTNSQTNTTANATANQNTNASANQNTSAQPPIAQAPGSLPDERLLVSFNPIVQLRWSSPDLLYFQTAYVKLLKIESESRTTFQRWHRLVLSPQAPANTR
ncbi:MAG: hypothetical protein ABR535_01400 [Pyrinomonadaceae bacterium]